MTYIGRIAREKNLGLLLTAWEALAPERGSAQLVLVGRGPLEDEHPAAGDARRARHRPDARAEAGRGLRLRRPLRLPLPHRDIRQLAAGGHGLRASLVVAADAAECWSSPSTAGTPGWWSPTARRDRRQGLRRLLHDPGLRRRLAAGAPGDRSANGLGPGVRSAAGGLSRGHRRIEA